MVAKLITPNNELLEVNLYELQNLFKKITTTAIENPELKQIFEEKYLDKMTKFSKEMEFCIKELGYKLYDPFNENRKEALIYNGSFQIVPMAINNDPYAKNMDKNYNNYASLNDENIKLVPTIEEMGKLETGIIDDDGFISTSAFSNREQFFKLYLLNIMIDNKIVANDYEQNRTKYKTVSEYLVERLGIAIIVKDLSDKYKFIYNDKTSSKILEFIDFVKDYEIINNTITMIKMNKAD